MVFLIFVGGDQGQNYRQEVHPSENEKTCPETVELVVNWHQEEAGHPLDCAAYVESIHTQAEPDEHEVVDLTTDLITEHSKSMCRVDAVIATVGEVD